MPRVIYSMPWKYLCNAMKIDGHTHLIPAQVPDWTKKFGYGDFIRIETEGENSVLQQGEKIFRVVGKNSVDALSRLHDLEKHEVSMQVISVLPVFFNYTAKPADAAETSCFLNDFIAGITQQHKNYFLGLGTIPLQDPLLAIEEMERCVKELQLSGVQIGSNVNGKNLSDKSFQPFFKAAEELNCSVFVHPWNMMGQDQMQEYWLPWLIGMPAESARAVCSLIFGSVFEKFPKLRVAFAHGGGSFAFTLGRIEQGFKVRPDLVATDNPVNPRNYLGRFWVDSAVHDARALQFLIDTIGEDSVFLGSDYPFVLGEHKPGRMIEKLDLGKKITRKLLYRNVLDWLGISEKNLPDFG